MVFDRLPFQNGLDIFVVVVVLLFDVSLRSRLKMLPEKGASGERGSVPVAGCATLCMTSTMWVTVDVPLVCGLNLTLPGIRIGHGRETCLTSGSLWCIVWRIAPQQRPFGSIWAIPPAPDRAFAVKARLPLHKGKMPSRICKLGCSCVLILYQVHCLLSYEAGNLV
jgi:hypothetical protein